MKPRTEEPAFFSLATLLIISLSFLLVGVPSVRSAGPDVKYRTGLPFEEVKVTRQVCEALQAKNNEKLLKALKLLEPVTKKLDEKFPDQSDAGLGKDVQEAVQSGKRPEVRRTTVRFLYFNLRDIMDIGHQFSKAGQPNQARVWVKKVLLLYKACLQPFVKNMSGKTQALKKVTVGIQKLNKNVNSPEKYKNNMNSVVNGLKNLFPEIGF